MFGAGWFSLLRDLAVYRLIDRLLPLYKRFPRNGFQRNRRKSEDFSRSQILTVALASPARSLQKEIIYSDRPSGLGSLGHARPAAVRTPREINLWERAEMAFEALG